MGKQGLPPWHMWGNSQLVNSPGLTVQSTQLIRINYGRPERWRWLFSAQEFAVQAGNIFSNADVDFDLTIGVGRSVVQIPSFEHFHLAGTASASPLIGKLIYSSSSVGPLRDFSVPTSASTILDFPAQDIQLVVRVNSDSICNVEVKAFFSPATHVRPEWHGGPEVDTRYPGDEHRGQ